MNIRTLYDETIRFRRDIDDLRLKMEELAERQREL